MVAFILREMEYDSCMIDPELAFVFTNAVSKIGAFICRIIIVECDGNIGLAKESQTSWVSGNRTDVATQCRFRISSTLEACRPAVGLLRKNQSVAHRLTMSRKT